MPRYTGRLVPSPSLPAALSSVQLILHGDGVLEQAVNALEVHAAVRHVLYGTESREGVEGGGLVNISPLWRGFRAPLLWQRGLGGRNLSFRQRSAASATK